MTRKKILKDAEAKVLSEIQNNYISECLNNHPIDDISTPKNEEYIKYLKSLNIFSAKDVYKLESEKIINSYIKHMLENTTLELKYIGNTNLRNALTEKNITNYQLFIKGELEEIKSELISEELESIKIKDYYSKLYGIGKGLLNLLHDNNIFTANDIINKLNPDNLPGMGKGKYSTLINWAEEQKIKIEGKYEDIISEYFYKKEKHEGQHKERISMFFGYLNKWVNKLIADLPNKPDHLDYNNPDIQKKIKQCIQELTKDNKKKEKTEVKTILKNNKKIIIIASSLLLFSGYVLSPYFNFWFLFSILFIAALVIFYYLSEAFYFFNNKFIFFMIMICFMFTYLFYLKYSTIGYYDLINNHLFKVINNNKTNNDKNKPIFYKKELNYPASDLRFDSILPPLSIARVQLQNKNHSEWFENSEIILIKKK